MPGDLWTPQPTTREGKRARTRTRKPLPRGEGGAAGGPSMGRDAERRQEGRRRRDPPAVQGGSIQRQGAELVRGSRRGRGGAAAAYGGAVGGRPPRAHSDDRAGGDGGVGTGYRLELRRPGPLRAGEEIDAADAVPRPPT
eukprot:2152788-Pleurochrysis_carterae.AAC.1